MDPKMGPMVTKRLINTSFYPLRDETNDLQSYREFSVLILLSGRKSKCNQHRNKM